MKTHLKNQTLLFLIISFFMVSCSTDTIDSQGLTTTNAVAKVKDPKPNVPTLTTTAASVITTTTASSGGVIINAKGVISAKGVVWSTSPDPAINLTTKTTDGTGLDGFTSSLTSLSPVTTYYVRAYATNGNGTGYGNQVSFTTPSIVAIGTQTWIAVNLNVDAYSDGTPIPEVTNPDAWAGLTTGAWCYYNNDPENGAVYGKLYNWYAVAGIHDPASLSDPSLRKQLAPTGYHIPTDAEWTTLTSYLGGEDVAGGAMKEDGTIHWLDPNTDATNSSGFTGLPGGWRDHNGTFDNIGIVSIWWSFTELDTGGAWVRYLGHNGGYAIRNASNTGGGFSVRCLSD
jgi:uncharacterized protein (TIGR02145 family)